MAAKAVKPSKLKFSKDTKRTYVFNTDADVPIPQVYVQKSAFEGQPNEIEVSIKVLS